MDLTRVKSIKKRWAGACAGAVPRLDAGHIRQEEACEGSFLVRFEKIRLEVLFAGPLQRVPSALARGTPLAQGVGNPAAPSMRRGEPRPTDMPVEDRQAQARGRVAGAGVGAVP
jgi:hypothetical protein